MSNISYHFSLIIIESADVDLVSYLFRNRSIVIIYLLTKYNPIDKPRNKLQCVSNFN